jgi:hypothetical protein
MMRSAGGRTDAARRAPIALSALALAALLVSCANMLSGSDITGDIATQVIEADAEKVTVSIQAMTGGKLSLNGPQVEKVSVPFSLTASANDAYAFSGWTVAGSGQVTTELTTETTAKFTIVKAATDIAITGHFVDRPKVSESSVDGDTTVPPTQAVTFTFTKGMDASGFTAANIAMMGKVAGTPGEGDDFSSYFSISWTSTTLTLAPKASYPAVGKYKVTILLAKNLRSDGGVTMQDDYQFSYFTEI